MNRNNDKISSFELGVLISLTILGIGVVNLPSSVTDSADNDAWLLLIVSGALAMGSALMMCHVGNRHSEFGFVPTLELLFGRMIGITLAVPVIAYALVVTATVLRLFAEVTKIYLLHKTPLEFIMLPILVMTVVLVRGGIEPIARSFGVFFFIIVGSIAFILITGYTNSDFSNLFPVMKTPITKILSGVPATVFAFSGFELLLVVFPYLRTPKKAGKVSAYVIISITLLYIVVTVYCIAKLGVEETKSTIWPLMEMVQSISIPGGFIENLEGVITAQWVYFAFTSLVGFLYLFVTVTQGVLKQKENRHLAVLSVPVVYLLSLQGGSMAEVFELSSKVMLYLGTYSMLVLPLLMLVMSHIRKGKRGGSQ